MNKQNNFFGKRALMGLVVLLLMLAGPQRAQAQWLTTDLPHIAVQSAEFIKKASDWVQTLGAYRTAANLYTTAVQAKAVADDVLTAGQRVRDLTSDGLNLANQIQNDLKRVQSQFTNLRLSSFGDVLTTAQNLAGAHGGLDYAPTIRGTGAFFNTLSSFGGGTASQAAADRDRLAGIFSPSSKPGNQTPDQLHEATGETALNTYALEQQHIKQLIQQSGDYRRMADELTAKAADTQTKLTANSDLKLTEGERAMLLQSCSGQLADAARLRQQSADMLSQAAERGPATRAAEGLYQEAITATTVNNMLSTFQD